MDSKWRTMRHRSRNVRRVAAGLVIVAVVSGGLCGLGRCRTSDGSFDLGSTARALKNPDCDPQAKRIKFRSTRCTVREAVEGGQQWRRHRTGRANDDQVVVLLSHAIGAATLASGFVPQPGDRSTRPERAEHRVTDWNEVFKHSYETWGRKVDLVFVKATGADEASQRAGAVAVAAMKPSPSTTCPAEPDARRGLVFQTSSRNEAFRSSTQFRSPRKRPTLPPSAQRSSSVSRSQATKPSGPAATR
jgi:hypothetical protein